MKLKYARDQVAKWKRHIAGFTSSKGSPHPDQSDRAFAGLTHWEGRVMACRDAKERRMAKPPRKDR